MSEDQSCNSPAAPSAQDWGPGPASQLAAGDVSCSRTRRVNGRARTVQIIEVTRDETESLFNASFWLECEREAALILRAITGVDGE